VPASFLVVENLEILDLQQLSTSSSSNLPENECNETSEKEVEIHE